MPRKFFQFHTSSMVNLLRQKLLPNVQRRLFFFGRNCGLEFTEFLEPVKNKKTPWTHQWWWNSWVWLMCFFFPFLLDDCTWKLHQVAFPWGHKQKLEKKRWKGSYDESISLSILIETFGVFWLLKLRDPKDCFVMLHCHVWWCIGCKGCANWSQSPSKVPAVPPGTQAAWAGGTRGCMKPYKIGGARLVRWVWEAHLPWLAAYLSKRTAESIMRSRKTDPISRHHPDSVFSSLILIVFTMNRWHSSTTLYYSDVFSNCDFPIHWQVKHCSHEDPMASEWACSDTSDRLDLESYEAMKLSVTLSG